MAVLRRIPLPVQVDMIFQDLGKELCGLTAGAVFLHVQDNMVTTYGVRHKLENRLERNAEGRFVRPAVSPDHIEMFREMAADMARRQGNWSRGTLSYKFSIRRGVLHISADFTDQEWILG